MAARFMGGAVKKRYSWKKKPGEKRVREIRHSWTRITHEGEGDVRG